MTRPAPPSHLGKRSRAFFREVTRGYDLDPAGIRLLVAACEALDRAEEARLAVARDGAYVEGRFGLKAHPALAVERDARVALVRTLRELNLEGETASAGRTGAIR